MSEITEEQKTAFEGAEAQYDAALKKIRDELTAIQCLRGHSWFRNLAKFSLYSDPGKCVSGGAIAWMNGDANQITVLSEESCVEEQSSWFAFRQAIEIFKPCGKDQQRDYARHNGFRPEGEFCWFGGVWKSRRAKSKFTYSSFSDVFQKLWAVAPRICGIEEGEIFLSRYTEHFGLLKTKN